MVYLKLAIGVLFFLLGWIYLYNANLVLALNRFIRETVFNDRVILLARKKLAIVFFCLSFIALYMGLTALGRLGEERSDRYLMYLAMQDYCAERYESAADKYGQILDTDPDNVAALRQMALSCEALGRAEEARSFWRRVLRAEPDDADALTGVRKTSVVRERKDVSK